MAKCVVCFMLLLSLILVEIGAVFNFEEDTPHAIEPRSFLGFNLLTPLLSLLWAFVPAAIKPLVETLTNTMMDVISPKGSTQPPLFIPPPQTGGANLFPPAGGNPFPPGGGNLVPPGGGNMFPPPGGNLFPPGGGNPFPPGGGNPFPPGGGNPFLPGGPHFNIMDQVQKAAQQANQLQHNQNNWQPTTNILKQLQNAIGGIQKIQRTQPELVKGPQLSPIFAKVVETIQSISQKLMPKKDYVSVSPGTKKPADMPKSMQKALDIIKAAFEKKKA